jgi:sulfur-oxidizing protein SoxA
MKRGAAEFLGAVLLLLLAAPAARAEEKARSGFDYLTPETQALQQDEFANPGMLWVEQGGQMWRDGGKSCASCHGDPGALKGVAARYPAFDANAGRVLNLEQRINQCRTERQGLPPLAYESQELLALTALVSFQSRGLPVQVAIDGPAAASFARGKAFFYQRRGQLDIACSQCHEQRAGQHLRGELISQGQTNGYPLYRQLWQTLASSHRMFAWCNEAVRAEPYPAGAQDYVDLELFLRWRGQGLPIETPAVRR